MTTVRTKETESEHIVNFPPIENDELENLLAKDQKNKALIKQIEELLPKFQGAPELDTRDPHYSTFVWALLSISMLTSFALEAYFIYQNTNQFQAEIEGLREKVTEAVAQFFTLIIPGTNITCAEGDPPYLECFPDYKPTIPNCEKIWTDYCNAARAEVDERRANNATLSYYSWFTQFLLYIGLFSGYKFVTTVPNIFMGLNEITLNESLTASEFKRLKQINRKLNVQGINAASSLMDVYFAWGSIDFVTKKNGLTLGEFFSGSQLGEIKKTAKKLGCFFHNGMTIEQAEKALQDKKSSLLSSKVTINSYTEPTSFLDSTSKNQITNNTSRPSSPSPQKNKK